MQLCFVLPPLALSSPVARDAGSGTSFSGDRMRAAGEAAAGQEGRLCRSVLLGEGGRDCQAGVMPGMEPDMGLDFMTLRS